MYKIKVKYKDPTKDGMECKDEFLFHLTQAEILRIEARHGGLRESFDKYMKLNNMDKVLAIVEDIILSAYGVRGENNRFIKNTQLREEFSNSEAYSEIFIEMLQKPEKVKEFIDKVSYEVKDQNANNQLRMFNK